MLEDFRRLEKIVGRRAAIKYGGIGLVSVVLAACGGSRASEDKKSGSDKEVLFGAVVEAFARGTWNLSISPRGKVNYEYSVITIADGAWDLDKGDRTGTYTLDGGGILVDESNYEDQAWVGTGLPGRVGDTASATLRWGPSDSAADVLPVDWDGTTLTIRTKDDVVITAVRA